jgi:hypothetical protein
LFSYSQNAPFSLVCTFSCHILQADKLDKVEICQAISTFARCIAEADFDARFTKIAEAELQTAQSENGACELRVSPTVNVVDRKLRFVTAEDVTFEVSSRVSFGLELPQGFETILYWDASWIYNLV